MSSLHYILMIAVSALVTAGIRFAPFVLLGGERKTPERIAYLGRVLPYAIMGMLVVYSLKHISFATAPLWSTRDYRLPCGGGASCIQTKYIAQYLVWDGLLYDFGAEFLLGEELMDLYQKNYTVVGLGMEGGSYALAIKKYIGDRVYGIDIDSKTCVKAQHAGIITNKPIEDILKDTDVLILALYPRECIRFLEKYQQMLRPRTLITDVCGVKAFLLEKIPQLLREDLVYVAGHPMAGNQYRGFDNADIRIFEDKNYILVPHEKNTPEDIAFVEALAKAIGCREVTKVDLYTHEKKIAYASHMMHFISVCVTNSPTYDESLDFFAGGSFRDLTRISDINPYLWSETFLLNKEYLLEELKLYKNNIEYLENALIMNDEERIVEFLEKSRRKKSGER